VLSTENITQNWYFGNERSMLIPNCLFRIGGAAMYLTNRRRDWWHAKYELLHTVRTHKGSNDKAFHCVYQMEDPNGNVGVKLAKELMAVAGEALKANITRLGPLVLPVSEQLLFFFNLVARKVPLPQRELWVQCSLGSPLPTVQLRLSGRPPPRLLHGIHCSAGVHAEEAPSIHPRLQACL